LKTNSGTKRIMENPFRSWLNIVIVVGWVSCFLLPFNTAMAQNHEKNATKAENKTAQKQLNPSQPVSIDFNNVDINVLVKFISEMTGKNFIVDQRVKGKVTIISPSKISVAEAYRVFESVLEVHGYTTVEAGKIIKIVPAPDARSKNIETRLREESSVAEDKVVTQLIPLKYANPSEVKKLLSPLVSKSSVILAYPPTNMLIVTDVYSNIKRLQKIVETIDIMGIGQELSILPLNHANAKDLVKILQSVFTARKTKSKKAAVTDTINFVADDRTNTLIVLASKTNTHRIKELVDMLDKETPKGKEGIHVYYLENAVAEDLAKVLQELPTQKSAQGSSKDPKKAPLISSGVIIKADKATNSLIIMAEKEDYNFLEIIIKKLDIPRSMVYIECLIMEVNLDKDFNIGTEWTAAGETTYNGRQGAYGGGFSGQDPGYSNIAGMGGGITGVGTFPPGLSLGVLGEFIDVGGIKFPSIAAVVQAYKKDKDVHILATPQLLTTDNEEASINVGKNVPFQTRSAAETGIETYSSYEYRDVGITLKITPHISKERFVRLTIFEEITKLDELATTSPDRPTTLKRTIETTVIVNDQNTIVLGGLIDDSFSRTENKIPCLGDIPLLGWFFKSVSESREKTNLFIFLTPHVIENEEEAAAIYGKKKGSMDEKRSGSIKMYDEDPVFQQQIIEDTE
jgi:general secretion pathway protein D